MGAALTRASAATLDRLLRPLRRRRPRQPRRSRARPGRRCAPRCPLLHLERVAGFARAPCKAISSCTVGSPPRAATAPRWSPSTWPPRWTELQALCDLHHQRVTGAIQHIHAAPALRPARVAQRQWQRVHQRRLARLVPPPRGPLHPRAALSQERPGLGRAAQRPARAPPRRLRPLQLPRRPGPSCSASTACSGSSTTSSAPSASCSASAGSGARSSSATTPPRPRTSGCSPPAGSLPSSGKRWPRSSPRSIPSAWLGTFSTPWTCSGSSPILPPSAPGGRPVGNTILRHRPRRSVTPTSEASQGWRAPAPRPGARRLVLRPGAPILATSACDATWRTASSPRSSSSSACPSSSSSRST